MESGADRGDVEGGVGEGRPVAVPGAEAVEAVEGVAEPAAPREPSVLDVIQDDLEGVERALERLDDGSYGSCQACGVAIDDAVLAGRPTARFCAEHEPAPTSQG